MAVTVNNHKRTFEVRTRRQTYPFPYARATPAPSTHDRLEEVLVDPELSREAFTYRLSSGAEGSVHIDEVLEYNEDPTYRADMILLRLTHEARKRFESSDLSVREIARWLDTSPTQLYRLLDTTNSSNSLRQMLSLLHLLGCEVEIEVKERRDRAVAS